MLLDMILKGLSWGLFGVAALIPLYAFSIAWSWLGPILKRSEEEAKEELEFLTDLLEEDHEEKPELPSNEEPPPRYKYIASTIVRPPSVVRREDKDDGD